METNENKGRYDAFSTCHPVVNLIYYIFVIGFAMASNNPVCLGISFICAFVYSVCLRGKRGIRKNLMYMVPLIVLTALLNPMFSHQGVTILTYLPSGNPLTLESVLYGISAAFMLVTIVCIVVCFNEVMTSDKMVYLFGRLAPYLSLLLSMTLKFIPEFINRCKVVYMSQKAAGYTVKGKYGRRIRIGIRVLSSAITWALERAVTTADSMRSRGYGLKGRTAYSIFRWDRRDIICLVYILITGIYVLIGMCKGAVAFQYYPYVTGNVTGVYTVSVFVVYIMLSVMPVTIYRSL
jgi:energy-coupling factor transport system permease protein